jgi:hypothetical protein
MILKKICNVRSHNFTTCQAGYKRLCYLVQRNPKAIAIRYDNIRTANIDIFPFMIHFTIEENKKRLIISAV